MHPKITAVTAAHFPAMLAAENASAPFRARFTIGALE
jgi:hypothetical protein